MHDSIRKVFPEVAHLIKWHLVSTDGPCNYLANTLYYAEDQRIKAAHDVACAESALADYIELNCDLPCGTHAETYIKDANRLRAIIGIAKDRLVNANGPDLEAARRSAHLPTATLEQLQSAEWLKEQLPNLTREFKEDMEATFCSNISTNSTTVGA